MLKADLQSDRSSQEVMEAEAQKLKHLLSLALQKDQSRDYNNKQKKNQSE